MTEIGDAIHFSKSEEVYPLARKVFGEECLRITEVFPRVIVEHVGSSIVPGALTLGDLDIQIRVRSEEFKEVREFLKSIYHENKPALWTNEFALFHKKEHPQLPVSIVLTVIDSAYDDFSKCRDLFISSHDALEKYNSLKMAYEGRTLNEYSAAKRAFFGPDGHNNLLK